MKTTNNRSTKYEVNDLFLNRYSPRAMSGENITKEELMTLFEAARWAPSSMNEQPWRFIYAFSSTLEFEKMFSFLAESNKVWAQKASVIVLIISKNNFSNGTPSPSHSFDTGAAWENLALQATNMNLATHGIGGFDYALAKKELEITDEYTLEMMLVIGKPGKIEDLPKALQKRESPAQRKELEEIVFEGKFIS